MYIYKKRKKNLICNYINGFLKVKQTTLTLSICQLVANFTIKKFQLAHVMLKNVFSRRCKIFYPIKAKFNSNILEVKGHVINGKRGVGTRLSSLSLIVYLTSMNLLRLICCSVQGVRERGGRGL